MRQQVAFVRLRPGQVASDELLLKTYNATVSNAANEVIQLWAGGEHPVPTPNGVIEVVKLLNGTEVVGFAAYLVWAEPPRLGPMRTEQVPSDASPA